MFRVLLVEDADLFRRDIAELLDWGAHQCEIVGEARNGEQGLQLFRELSPDIVITDIKMPVMTGIEMIRRIREQGAAAQFILLTAYEEFAYAKQAIALGVNSYLLKHEVDAGTLLRELSRVKDQLASKDKLNFLTMGQYFKTYLNGGALPDTFAGLLDTPQILLLCAPVSPVGSLLHMDSYEYWFALCEHFRDWGKVVSIVMSPLEGLVLIPTGRLSSQQRIRERGLAFARAFQEYQQERYHFGVHLALGGQCASSAGLRDAYARARPLLMDGVFNQRPAIVETQPQTVDEDAARQVRGHLRELERLVADHRYDKAKEPAAAMMEALSDIRYPPLFQEVVRSAELLLGDYAKRSGLIYPYETIDQAREALLLALDSLDSEQSARYTKRVRQMLRRVHEQYHTDLNLNALADELGVTAVYAGQLFKKETGKTFLAYLTEYRIGKAEELLREGNHKIYEVCEMVGYQSVPYFSKMFKRVTGKKPSDV